MGSSNGKPFALLKTTGRYANEPSVDLLSRWDIRYDMRYEGWSSRTSGVSLIMMMDGSRVTDFSIDHILSSDFPRSGDSSAQKNPGYHPPPGGAYLRKLPDGLTCYGDRCPAPRAPVALCAPGGVCCYGPGGRAASGLFSYGGFRPDLYSTDLTFHPTYLTFHPTDLSFYPRQQVRDTAGRAPAPPAEPPVPRSRVRTVFTASQTAQLERLFRVTDYPAADARAALSGNSGLPEETVRVWFKNRRARRKRQRSGPKRKSPRGSPQRLKPRDTLLSAVL